MTYQWAKSRFTAAELNGKSINFTVPLEQGGTETGEGKLEALANPQGLIAVRILKNFTTPTGAIGLQAIFIPVEALDKIVRNPAGSKCEFAINAL